MFMAHGEWKIIVKNNYVLQWFSGCWNEEAAKMYCQEFAEKTRDLSRGPWVIVSFLDDWELAIPEVEWHIHEHTRRLPKLGCTKHCQIYQHSAVKSIQLNKMCFKHSHGYERRAFESSESARLWLKSEGFLIKAEEFLVSQPVHELR